MSDLEKIKRSSETNWQIILDAQPQQPEVESTCFLPDSRKEGGACVTVTGQLKRMDELRRAILLVGGEIPIDDILDIQIKSEA